MAAEIAQSVIATCYGLDGPGIESWWGRDFSYASRPALCAHPASCTMGTGSFLGVKRPGLLRFNLYLTFPYLTENTLCLHYKIKYFNKQ